MSERLPNTGESFTMRQQKMLESEYGKERFKESHNVFLWVEQIRTKLGDADDWMAKARALDMGLYMNSAGGVRFNVDVSSVAADRIPAEVDVVKLVRAIPRNILACIIHYDPPSELEEGVMPQELCPMQLRTASFIEHVCNAAEVLLCFFHNVLLVMDHTKHTNHRMTLSDWVRFRYMLLSDSGDGKPVKDSDKPPSLLSETIEALSAYLCKVLGPRRAQLNRDIVEAAGIPERARMRMKTVFFLLLAVEKASLVTAMEVSNVRSFKDLPAPSTDQFFHYLFLGQTQGIVCLGRSLRFCKLLYRAFRERCTTQHCHLGQAPGERFSMPDNAAIDMTRKFALLTALILEPLERLLQSRPMVDVLQNHHNNAFIQSTNLAFDLLSMIKAGMSMLSPEINEPERQIYSCAFVKTPDERLGKPHMPSRILGGDVELLVARAYMLGAHVTTCLKPSLKELGGPLADGRPWWTGPVPDWFDCWMACAYLSIDLATKVLTRKWPTNPEDAFPEPKQKYEGQLSINAMRAAAAVCQSQCPAILNCQQEGGLYHKVWDSFHMLICALRSRLAMAAEDFMSRWCCGQLSRQLFCGEQFHVVPTSCKLRDAYGEMLCFEHVDMRPFLTQHYPREPVEVGTGRNRKGRTKPRPEDDVQVLLQACETGLRAWQILHGILSLELSASQEPRFQDTQVAKTLVSLVEAATQNSGSVSLVQAWAKIGKRVELNLLAMSRHVRRVESHIYKNNEEVLKTKIKEMNDLLFEFSSFLVKCRQAL